MLSSKAVALTGGVQENTALRKFTKFTGRFYRASANGCLCFLGKDFTKVATQRRFEISYKIIEKSLMTESNFNL